MTTSRDGDVELPGGKYTSNSYQSGAVSIRTDYLPAVVNGFVTGFTALLKASTFVSLCSPIEIIQNRGQMGLQGSLSFEHMFRYFKAGLKQSAAKIAIYSAVPELKNTINDVLGSQFNLTKEQQNAPLFNFATTLVASFAASLLEMPTQYFRNQRIFNSRGYTYKPDTIYNMFAFGRKGAGTILTRNVISVALFTGSSDLTKPLINSFIENPTSLQKNIISNVLIGTLVAFLVHPLDTAYKLQIGNTDLATMKTPSLLTTASDAVKSRGMTSLYKGVSWNVVRNIVVCGIISNMYHIDNFGKFMSNEAQKLTENLNANVSHNQSSLFYHERHEKQPIAAQDVSKISLPDKELSEDKAYKK